MTRKRELRDSGGLDPLPRPPPKENSADEAGASETRLNTADQGACTTREVRTEDGELPRTSTRCEFHMNSTSGGLPLPGLEPLVPTADGRSDRVASCGQVFSGRQSGTVAGSERALFGIVGAHVVRARPERAITTGGVPGPRFVGRDVGSRSDKIAAQHLLTNSALVLSKCLVHLDEGRRGSPGAELTNNTRPSSERLPRT